MRKEDCRIGMTVYFGSPNGEKTRGRIVRLNPAKAKVETLEVRGNGRPAGQTWGVPYDLLMPATGEAAAPVGPPPLEYNPFSEDNPFLELIGNVYCGLSPEHLACDGEASMAHIRRTRAKLERQLRGLQMALGRNVSEGEWHEWDESRRKATEAHKTRMDGVFNSSR